MTDTFAYIQHAAMVRDYLHSFNYMFSNLGVLNLFDLISFAVYLLAIFFAVFFVVSGSWLVYWMMVDPS